jgi:hypothetical protein
MLGVILRILGNFSSRRIAKRRRLKPQGSILGPILQILGILHSGDHQRPRVFSVRETIVD